MDTERETLPRNAVTEEEKSTIIVTKVTSAPPDTKTEETKSTITITREPAKDTPSPSVAKDEQKSSVTVTKETVAPADEKTAVVITKKAAKLTPPPSPEAAKEDRESLASVAKDTGKGTVFPVVKTEEKKGTVTVTKSEDADDIKLEVSVAKSASDPKEDGNRKLTILVGKDGIGIQEDKTDGADDTDGGINFKKEIKSNSEQKPTDKNEAKIVPKDSKRDDSKMGDKNDTVQVNIEESKSDKSDNGQSKTEQNKNDKDKKEENKSDQQKEEENGAEVQVKEAEAFEMLTEQEIETIISKYSDMDHKKRTQLLDFYFSIDTGRFGYITIHQFAARVRSGKFYYLEDREIARMFTDIDSDHDRLVSLEEYMREMTKRPRNFNDEELQYWYKEFDQDQDGFVSRKDIQITVEKVGLFVLPMDLDEYMSWDTSGCCEKLDFTGFCKCLKSVLNDY